MPPLADIQRVLQHTTQNNNHKSKYLAQKEMKLIRISPPPKKKKKKRQEEEHCTTDKTPQTKGNEALGML